MKFLFKKPANKLESYGKHTKVASPDVPDDMCIVCPSCQKQIFTSDVNDNLNVCTNCGHHFRINARQRLNIICDEGTFVEMDAEMVTEKNLDFPNYKKKLNQAQLESAEHEAVICGVAKIHGQDTAIFVMDPYFMMGTMGSVVGEKITRLFETATEQGLSVIGFTVSGGARMQEGILSLMQMAKTSAAVKKHSDAGLLYITVLTDPTTGGVTASFAMEGDIILSEPKALIGFAGPRVIEQTIRQKLPNGFQRAEFLLDKGFVDLIVNRKDQKEILGKLLSLHRKENA
ncbi:MAG: acetyl-CoA carboxylase carboxyltransferase subunit beta [Clostridia bacterium]|nr:acetyl-CoA carboxylase carboxyltransferase subunit beta [Clostridia bacterium]